MKPLRFFYIGLVSYAFGLSSSVALAQTQRLTLIAPFPPGGPVDTLARMVAEGLQKKTGMPALVDNLPGAAGNLGMEKVRRAKPDGQTLLLIPEGNLTINPSLMKNFPFNIERDFTPITMLAKAPNVLVVNPAIGVKTTKDLIALAKASALKRLAFASPGVGSGLHLAGELFRMQTGIELTHVPYKGSPQALNDVVGGQVPIMFTNLPAALPHIKAGKLLALGLTERERSNTAPDIPTLLEQGIEGVVVTSWYALMAPGGLGAPEAERLAREAQAVLAEPIAQSNLRAQGLVAVTLSPSEFAKHLRDETATWSRIIAARQITAE